MYGFAPSTLSKKHSIVMSKRNPRALSLDCVSPAMEAYITDSTPPTAPREWKSGLVYVILSYAITWIIVLPLVLSTQGILDVALPYAFHYLAPFGPLAAAFIASYIERGSEGTRALLRGLTRVKIRPTFIAIAVLSPWILFLIAGLASVLLEGAFPDLETFGVIPYGNSGLYLSLIGAWLVWLFTYGIGEETGWRGFLLPHVQKKHGSLLSALIVGVIWCFWHLPFFFYNPNFQAFGLFGSIMWAVGLLFGSILLTWLYNSCEGSILMVAIWHGTFNLFTGAYGQAVETTAGIISMLVMLLVVGIIAVFGPTNLSEMDRQTT
jgi:membrane protease YdiL (CAAX protease family)